jgi:hypothetical protein
MPGKVVEDSLPSVALLLNGMLCFWIERHPDNDSAVLGSEFDYGMSISKVVLNPFVHHDLCVSALEIEPYTPVLCLHPERKLAALAQIAACVGTTPVV